MEEFTQKSIKVKNREQNISEQTQWQVSIKKWTFYGRRVEKWRICEILYGNTNFGVPDGSI